MHVEAVVVTDQWVPGYDARKDALVKGPMGNENKKKLTPRAFNKLCGGH